MILKVYMNRHLSELFLELELFEKRKGNDNMLTNNLILLFLLPTAVQKNMNHTTGVQYTLAKLSKNYLMIMRQIQTLPHAARFAFFHFWQKRSCYLSSQLENIYINTIRNIMRYKDEKAWNFKFREENKLYEQKLISAHKCYFYNFYFYFFSRVEKLSCKL